VKPNEVTYDVDLSANTVVVVELEKNYSGDLIIPNPLNLGDKYFPVVVGIAIQSLKADEEPKQLFDISGRSIYHLTSGIHIIKYKKGIVKKVVVK